MKDFFELKHTHKTDWDVSTLYLFYLTVYLFFFGFNRKSPFQFHKDKFCTKNLNQMNGSVSTSITLD